jgi:hypothetical protein
MRSTTYRRSRAPEAVQAIRTRRWSRARVQRYLANDRESAEALPASHLPSLSGLQRLPEIPSHGGTQT